MTSGLNTPTGPALMADHERRIRDLERALRPTQTNLRKTRPKPFITVSSTAPPNPLVDDVWIDTT